MWTTLGDHNIGVCHEDVPTDVPPHLVDPNAVLVTGLDLRETPLQMALMAIDHLGHREHTLLLGRGGFCCSLDVIQQEFKHSTQEEPPPAVVDVDLPHGLHMRHPEASLGPNRPRLHAAMRDAALVRHAAQNAVFRRDGALLRLLVTERALLPAQRERVEQALARINSRPPKRARNNADLTES